MAVLNAETGKNKRLADGLLTRSDMGTAELREKLQLAEDLQQQGKLAESVQEYVAIGQFYTQHNQPMKAVQVLRQAARLQPDHVAVQVALGEGLAALKLVEDAATSFRRAATLLEAQGRPSDFLDIVQRLVDLDPLDLHGRLRLAEAMSRAGKTEEAARNFQKLAEALLSADETEDWEKVCERLLHHAPDNATVAHDLALHYVRSGRHALALPKLALCYETESSDTELLELITDTMESLGQREKAAAICRQLVQAYRKTGLHADADRALERLSDLDPDDAEARQHMGFLTSGVEGGTVLEFEAGPMMARRADSGRFTARRQASTGFGPGAASQHTAQAHSSAHPAAHSVPAEADEADFDGETALLTQPPSPQHAIVPPVPRLAVQPAQPSVPSHYGRPAPVPALDALADAVGGEETQDWPGDDEAGFETEDRTIVEHVVPAAARAAVPAIHWSGSKVRDTASAAPQVDAASAPSAQQPVVAARARSGSLPRPRLARHHGTVSELPSTVRDLSKDLGTLDFFIDRGFYDSAVALLDELLRRHPDSLQLRAYRQRVERMHRG